ncbi:MAG: 3-hydroxyisobutyrate dehydrogenase [Pseudomonadota bacterium]
MAKIAFIGLGAMGSGMAAVLADKGHEVSAYDLNPEAMAKAAAAGCGAAATIADAVKDADFIITMLPNANIVNAVYAGDDGVFRHAKPNALLIDCSTIGVSDARHLGEDARSRGFDFIDAPVSGGVAAAAAGTLAFMVGASETQFARAQIILQDMAKAVIHAGDIGAGQAAKLCNNMLLASSMIATCESFILAEKLGLDAKIFFDIASQSSGQNWSLTSYAPVKDLVPNAPVNRDFDNGFAGSLMLKDICLALNEAEINGFHPAMAQISKELYSKYVVNVGNSKDFSGIINMLRQ